MTSQPAAEGYSSTASREETISALFAHLVMQQSNMAMMMLGKVAHPDTGQPTKNLEAAKLFIDQLEMLEVKTHGNLTKEEASLLKQTLMTLRLTFVEAVESGPAPAEPHREAARPSSEASHDAGPTISPGSSEALDEEHRKKFSKKY